MFDKIDKNKRIILYFFIGISFLFILPILFWIGFFIGYQTCKNSMVYQVQETLATENEVDKNYLEIDV